MGKVLIDRQRLPLENILDTFFARAADVACALNNNSLKINLRPLQFIGIHLRDRDLLVDWSQRRLVDHEVAASVVGVPVGHGESSRLHPGQSADLDANVHGTCTTEFDGFAPVGQPVLDPVTVFEAGCIDLHVPVCIGLVIGDDRAVALVKCEFLAVVDNTASAWDGVNPKRLVIERNGEVGLFPGS